MQHRLSGSGIQTSTGVLNRPLARLEKGETATLTRSFKTADLTRFSALSGDWNPLHTDDAYARESGFDSRVVHGILVAAPVSRMAGHLLPGRRCLLLGSRFQFPRPVYTGDRITYLATVRQVSEASRAVKVSVEATNQKDEIVLRGSYDALVRDGEETEEPMEVGVRSETPATLGHETTGSE